MLSSILDKFIDSTIIEHTEQMPWKSEFRGSSLPVCNRQLMLSQFYADTISTPQSFTQKYHFEVGRSIHRLVQATWAKQSILWGDWQCIDRENCGAFFQNMLLEKGRCIRCGSPADYIEKTIKDEESGFSGHCDGVVWCDPLKGFLTVELKSRNHNIIKDREGQEPYESDFYQVSAYATLIARQCHLPITGRLILWIGKPKPKPYLFWFYPGVGEELFESQVQARKVTLKMIKEGKVLEVFGVCGSIEDVGSCPFGGICFSPKKDTLVLEAFKEWRAKNG